MIERERLRGIWGFHVTPFDDQGEVDLKALRLGVDTIVEGGTNVVIALGQVAEVTALTRQEWALVLQTVVETVNRRCPVIATISTSMADPRSAAAYAADLGVAGLMILPEDNFDAASLKDFLIELSESSPLGLIVYQRGSVCLEPRDLEQLIQVDRLFGIKDGQRDLARFRRLREAFKDRLFFSAAFEDLAPAYWAMGADALCPACMIHDQAYTLDWFSKLQQGDFEGARKLMAKLSYPLIDLRMSRPGISITVIKEAMRLRGLPGGRVRPPSLELTQNEKERLQAILTQVAVVGV